MATSARNRRLEPAYKQHTAVDDVRGHHSRRGGDDRGSQRRRRDRGRKSDAVAATTGSTVKTITADQGYAYGKVYGALERRGIDPVIPAKKEPIRSQVPLASVPLRRPARHPEMPARGGSCAQASRIEHGRFFYSKSKRVCRGCPMRGATCLSAGSRRTRPWWSATIILPCCGRADARSGGPKQDARLYQRHRWRSEGFHGEAKCWHGLARAIRRGLQNMRVQAFLIAAWPSTSSGSPQHSP